MKLCRHLKGDLDGLQPWKMKLDKCLALRCSTAFLCTLSLQDWFDHKGCYVPCSCIWVARQPLASRCRPYCIRTELTLQVYEMHTSSAPNVADLGLTRSTLTSLVPIKFKNIWLAFSFGFSWGSLRPLLGNGVRRHRQKTEHVICPQNCDSWLLGTLWAVNIWNSLTIFLASKHSSRNRQTESPAP